MKTNALSLDDDGPGRRTAKTTTAKATKTPADPAPADARIAGAKANGLVWVNLNTKVYHTEGSSTARRPKASS